MNVKNISKINTIKINDSSDFTCIGLDLIQMISEHLIEHIHFSDVVLTLGQTAINKKNIYPVRLKQRSNHRLLIKWLF